MYVPSKYSVHKYKLGSVHVIVLLSMCVSLVTIVKSILRSVNSPTCRTVKQYYLHSNFLHTRSTLDTKLGTEVYLSSRHSKDRYTY